MKDKGKVYPMRNLAQMNGAVKGQSKDGVPASTKWYRENREYVLAYQAKQRRERGILPIAEENARRRRIASERWLPVLAAVEAGLPFSAVAEKFGLTRNQVAGIVDRARKAEAAR